MLLGYHERGGGIMWCHADISEVLIYHKEIGDMSDGTCVTVVIPGLNSVVD